MGRIPSRQLVDLSASYQVNPYLRIYGIATNLLDQPRYQLYGGSVTGIRVLGGVTLTL